MKESTIEKAFCEYLDRSGYSAINRQVELPIGRLDVLAHMALPDHFEILIAEIKLNDIDEKACTQLLGYLGQLERLVDLYKQADVPYLSIAPRGVLVGSGITPMAARVANTYAANISFCQYTITDNLISFDWQAGWTHHLESLSDYQPNRALLTTIEALNSFLKSHKTSYAKLPGDGDPDSYYNTTTGKIVTRDDPIKDTQEIWKKPAAPNETE